MHYERTLTNRPARSAWALILLLAVSGPLMAQRADRATSTHAGHDHDDLSGLLNMHDQEIHFVENKGQFGPTVLYRADFPLGQAIATREGMLMSAFDPRAVEARQREGIAIEEEMQRGLPHRPLRWQQRGHGWLMHFRNASPAMRMESKDAHEETTNYFLGDKAQHATGVRSFQEVWYKEVYKGTDVRYYPAADGSLEYDIICKPGSDPSLIGIELKGIDRIRVNEKGELVMTTSLGDMSYPAPIVYQRVNGREKKVRAAYKVEGANVLRFELGAYDRTQPLVIDPIAMRWATWVNTNSSGDNHGHAIWVDPTDGAIYVVARVVGTTDQITVGAFDTSANGNLEMIVGKYLEPASVGGSGTRVWQTYIGGGGDDNPYAMEQGPDGNLYITGQTSSTNFPLIGGSAFTGSSINQQSQSGIDVFVLKITQDGLSIKAAVVGGNGADDNFDVRTAANGDVLVCGSTTSTNLLTLNAGSGATNGNSGSSDVMIFRINQDLSSLVWMRNYGGSGADRASIMLHNSATGDLFVGGNTSSTNFPTTSPRQASRGGSTAGFLQRLNGTTAATTWSSYFSSDSGDDANLLCMEFNTTKTELYFGGVTEGLNAANITAGSHDTGHNGNNDFYVARMDINQNFLAGTYIGGSNNEVNMMGLNVDLNNDAYVFGYTNSTNFPVSASPNVPLQSSNQGNNDKVFFKLESDLSALEFSTYYGGASDDYDPVGERGIKFSNCRIYTIVTAQSNNIPLTQGALNTTKSSSTSRYEPGLVVWANPPDLLGNTINYQGVAICPGSTPGDIIGSVPNYTLPTIVRNNNTSNYPAFPSAATYQWQISPDSLNWTNINGATGQNLTGAQIGAITQTTYIRRIIGGDACILAGAADQVVTVRLMSVTGTSTNVTCNGLANGTATAVADGQEPFTYLWSNGQSTQTATGLAPGGYTVTVTDFNGCSAQGNFHITQPAVLGGEVSSIPATCSNANGSAMAIVSGGTGPYSYLWSNGGAGASISGVQGGTYNVTITDANNCEITLPVSVGSSGTPAVSAGDDMVITCTTGPSIALNGSGSAGVNHAWVASNGGNIVSGANTANPQVNAAGTYTLTVTDPQTSCSASDVVQITMNTTAPNASINGGGTLTCTVTSLLLDGSSTTQGATFSWSGPNGFASTDDDVTASEAGTYELTVTDPSNGCTSTAQAEVDLDDEAPGAQATGGTLTCTTTSLMLTGSGNGSFAWTGPNNFSSADQNPTVSLAGTYSLTVTGTNGCTSTAQAEVDLDDEAPDAQATGGTLTCTTTSVMLTGSGNGSFAWTGPNNFSSGDQNPTVSVAGTYILTVTGSNGCTSMAQAEVDLDDETPGAQATGGTLTCTTTSVMLTGSGNGSFAWTGPNNFSSGDQNPTVSVAGTYILTVTGSNGCTSMAQAEVGLDDEAPGAQATGGTLTCTTTSVMLTGSGNGSFAWTGPNNFSSGDQNPTVSVAGTYVLTVTGANGCTSMAQAEVGMDSDLPGAQATGGTLTCTTTSVMLNGSGNGSFAWTGPNNFSSGDQNPTVSVAGTYVLTVTGANGCNSMAQAEVGMDSDLPSAQATGGTLTCTTTSVMLNGSGNGSFAWTGPNNFSSGDQNPTVSVAGTYSLTVTGTNGCTSMAQAEVGMDSDLPDAQATGGTLTCTTTSVMLTGSGNGSFAWTGPNNFSSGDQNPTVSVAGTYILTVTGSNGCTSMAQAEVGLDDEAPGAQATGGTLTCTTTSVMLTGSGNGSFAWTGPNNFSSGDQNPTVSVAGTYVLTVTGANGCTSMAQAEVGMDSDLPGAQATGGTLTCTTTSVMLNGSGNGSFAWTGPNNFSSGDQNPTVSVAGTYVLTVTGANGCNSMAQAEVGMDSDLPSAQATGGTLTCTTTSVMLNGSGNGSFAWTGPNNFSSGDQNPTVSVAGTYSLTVTGTNGCTSMAQAEVGMDSDLPDAQATGGTLTCTTTSVMLTGSGNGSFAWTGPNNFSSGDQNPTVSVAGTYVLTVTGSNGCTSMAQAEVDLDDAAPGAQATGGTLTCTTTSVMLTGSGNGSFAWTGPNNFSSGDQNPVVNVAGTYILTVTGGNGCTSMAQTEVGMDSDLPGAQATGGTLTCTTTSVMLTGSGNGSFAWTGPNNFSSGDQNPTVSVAGTYVLTVTGSNGCTSMAQTEVGMDSDLPGAQASGGTLTCTTTSVMLTGSGNGSFAWTGPNNFSSGDQNPTVSVAGTYVLTVTGSNGCTSMAQAEVGMDSDLPGAQASGGTLTCTTTSVMLTGSGNGSFAWTGPNNFMSGDQNPTVSVAGTYVLTVTGSNGCTSMAQTEVGMDSDLPGAQATGGTLTCTTTSVMLTGSGNGSFAWTGPNNFSSGDQNPTVNEAGTYILTVTGANGCTSMASAVVDGDTNVPTLSSQGGAIDCTSGTAQIFVSSNMEAAFTWTGPNNFNSTTQNPIVSVAGTYTVVAMPENGCSSETSVTVIACESNCGPLIISCPQDITVQCAEDFSPFGVAGEPVFRKDKKCPELVDVGWTDLILSNCPYVIRRTFWVEDATGAYETCQQIITVIDEVAPILQEVPQDINMACDADIDGCHIPDVWAYDECIKSNVPVAHSMEIIPGNCAGSYRIVHTWTATDQCGNVGTASWTINVQDTEPPVLHCNVEDVLVDCDKIPEPCTCQAEDNCDGDVQVSVEDVKGDLDEFGKYVITRTYTATDDCGNSTSLVQLITVWCDKKPGKGGSPKILASVSPNPFREESTISFTANERGKAQLEVTDMQGRKIADLYSGEVEADIPMRFTFKPVENGSGIFLYRITLNGEVVNGRMFYQP